MHCTGLVNERGGGRRHSYMNLQEKLKCVRHLLQDTLFYSDISIPEAQYLLSVGSPFFFKNVYGRRTGSLLVYISDVNGVRRAGFIPGIGSGFYMSQEVGHLYTLI